MTEPQLPAAQDSTRTATAKHERYRQLIASAQDAVVVMDTSGRVVDWNPCAERMFGWVAEEAIGAQLSALIVPPALRERHEAGLRRYVETRQGRIIGQSVELVAVSRSGHEIPIELSLWPLESDGELLFGAFIHDIHARKVAEHALREQEKKYRQVVDHGSEGILVVRDGQIVFANPSTERLVGATMVELRAQPFTHFIHPDDRALVVDRHVRRLRGEPVADQYSFRVVRKNGELVWLELSVVSIEWEGLPATLSFIIDITERKRLETNLRRSLNEQEAILQSTLIGISLLSEQRFQWVNRTLAAMLGYRPEQLIGQHAGLLFADALCWETFFKDSFPCLERDGSYTSENQLRHGNGHLIWLQLQGTRIGSDDGAASSLWTFIDITERKRAEQDMQNNLARERELSQLKSRFVSMTSHEFRTPLAGILSSTELLRHYGDRLPAEEKTELFEQIESSVERMARMLDNILLIGRADAQGLQFRPAPMTLPPLCHELVEEVERSRIGDGIAPRVVLDCQVDEVEYLLDAALLRHILVNLLSNACKYSPAGGEVRFEVSLDRQSLRFVVADQGIGIPLADQPRLFESFHRASNVGNISGTGLGLAIVKQSVELHGGRITLDSAPGSGSRFTVDIPIGTRTDA